MAGVDGLLALPLLVVVMMVVWMPSTGSTLFSISLFNASFRLPTTMPPIILASSCSASSSRCSPFEYVPVSFMEALISSIVRPVIFTAAERSGVPTPFPFCLFGAGDEGRVMPFSTTDWVEFCLPFVGAILVPPFIVGGVACPVFFISGNVLRTGEEAIEGDIAIEVTVLFLKEFC